MEDEDWQNKRKKADDEGSPFFHPRKQFDEHRRNLPHWQQDSVWVFVTWRLADSLPKEKLVALREERDQWIERHPPPWDVSTEETFHRLFSDRIDRWLDEGSGSCLLRKSAHSQIVAEALTCFDGIRYALNSFVVMPNHVHVLFQPLQGHRLSRIIKSWKGFTARRINECEGRKGTLWQDEYWDRLIRNERHLFKVRDYIRHNPHYANLPEGQFVYWERSE